VTLHVVATPIGNLGDITARAVDVLTRVGLIACEDTRRTGSLLRHLGVERTRMMVVNDHTERGAVDRIVERLVAGEEIALVSDAGTPLVSDPGHVLVRAAIAAGVTVEAVPGASAVLVALVTSGLATDRFAFDGFLPRKGLERSRRIAEVVAADRTTVLFEAPHRLARTLADLAALTGDQRGVVVARELTKLHEEVWRGTIGDAVERAAVGEPRGEHVIVLEAAPDVPTGDDDVLRELQRALDGGASRRDAIDEVARSLGVARNHVYQLALALDGD